MGTKPKITFLVDYPNWAFDYVARSIALRLKERFRFIIKYRCYEPRLNPKDTDLLYIFFWGESWHQRFGFEKSQIIKEVASYRWRDDPQYGQLSVQEFVANYLFDAGTVTTPSDSIYEDLEPFVDNLYLCPNGVENNLFRPGKENKRIGELKIGWVGNPQDKCKGLSDILMPASKGFNFRWTNGRLLRQSLIRFYREIDVLAIASSAESQPLTLLEAMSCGVYPVSTNVGIVSQFIKDSKVGLIVERKPSAFQDAFRFVSNNIYDIRVLAQGNRQIAESQSWDRWAARFGALFDKTINAQSGIISPEISRNVNRMAPFTGPSRTPYFVQERTALNDLMIRIIWGSRYKVGYGAKVKFAARGLMDLIKSKA